MMFCCDQSSLAFFSLCFRVAQNENRTEFKSFSLCVLSQQMRADTELCNITYQLLYVVAVI